MYECGDEGKLRKLLKYIRPAVFFIRGDLKIKLMYILREAAKSFVS